MDTNAKKVSFFDPESNKLVEVHLSAEDALRVQNDVVFATTIMNAATKEQESWRVSNNSDQNLILKSSSISTATNPSPLTNQVSSVEGETVNDHESEDGSSLYRWTNPCVLLLLETYKAMKTKFSSGKQPQKKIWEEISGILLQRGHTVTGGQCAAKLRSLKKTYKSIKDYNNKSGNNRKTWHFYEIMDEIFSKRAWCAPVAVASSTGVCNKRDDGAGSASDSGCANEPSTSKISATSLLRKRLHQKEEHEQAKAKRHKERMEMDDRLLKVLEKLVDKE